MKFSVDNNPDEDTSLNYGIIIAYLNDSEKNFVTFYQYVQYIDLASVCG